MSARDLPRGRMTQTRNQYLDRLATLAIVLVGLAVVARLGVIAARAVAGG